MSKWYIQVIEEAKKEFYNLPKEVRTKIREVLRRECDKEDLYLRHTSLSSTAPGWSELRAAGKYRVIYELTCDGPKIFHVGTMTIMGVGHRKKIERLIIERYKKYG